ncbi:hypothetical protein ACP70R_020847 [Stipagrostis hirtigluma subsp. patula]
MNPAGGMIPAGAAFLPAQPPFFAAPLYAPTLRDVFPALPPPGYGVNVNEVWADNLSAEVDALRFFAQHARYVAVTVHYPGVVHGAGQSYELRTAEERYAIVKANVDALKPVQVGVAVCAGAGALFAWEFNLRDFHPDADRYATRSVEYLSSRGLDFDRHRQHGIPMATLTMALRSCGLIHRRPGVSWLTYSGAYHAAYLLKVITGGSPLPRDMAGFLAAVRRFLGDDVYDVARIADDCPTMPVGLECIAHRLNLAPPLVSPRLAGANSVLILQAFITMTFAGGNLDRYRGVLKGLQAL